MAANLQRALDRINAKETAGKAPEETAAPKATTDYTWYKYNADRATNLKTTNGKRTARLAKGVKFGVREGSKGSVRLVTEEHGPTIVFTLTEKQRDALVGKSRKAGAKPKSQKTNVTRPGTPKATKDKLNKAKQDAFKESKQAKQVEDTKALIKRVRAQAKQLAKIKFDTAYAQHVKKIADLIDKMETSDLSITGSMGKKLISLLELGHSSSMAKEVDMGNGNIKAGKGLLGSAKYLLGRAGVSDMTIEDGEFVFDDLLSLYLSDAADHILLGRAIVEGRMKDAKKLSDLDTASRDEIPEKTWNWIEENLR